jgi:hypothetical protein
LNNIICPFCSNDDKSLIEDIELEVDASNGTVKVTKYYCINCSKEFENKND